MGNRPLHSHQSSPSSCRVQVLPSNHHAPSPLASSPQSVSSPPVMASLPLPPPHFPLHHIESISFVLTQRIFPDTPPLLSTIFLTSSYPPFRPSSLANSTTSSVEFVAEFPSSRPRYFSIPNFN